ncbi:MAG: hypothetical protein LBT66_02565, partial [Methanobrevibacter sp.]|nr:hypothetical protein [Candidatus Methanovirga meridionalis]
YENFKTTITISILNYNLVKGSEFFEYQTTTFTDKDKTKGKIEHYLIQLPKFRKQIKKLIKKNMDSNISQIIYMIKNYIEYYCF